MNWKNVRSLNEPLTLFSDPLEILTIFAIAHSESGGPFSNWYNTSSIWQLKEVKNTCLRGECGYCCLLVRAFLMSVLKPYVS